MPYIRDRINHDVTLTESTQLYGMINGTVTVLEKINFQLHGIVTGNLILKKHAEVYVHGTVNGDITNEGGILVVFGNVDGTITTKDGKTSIDANAKVKPD